MTAIDWERFRAEVNNGKAKHYLKEWIKDVPERFAIERDLLDPRFLDLTLGDLFEIFGTRRIHVEAAE